MNAIEKALLPLYAMALTTPYVSYKRKANENINVSPSRKPGRSKFKPNQFKKRKGRSA